ncbi:DNA-protecting protein DprA [Aphanothece hegewaldii CCALA 016]|uniref:DNA-protecting protein DprA n=1 Tax=Aphanothece hegewaldii CCALA 016 TaxID=2107694 RepID=A0A2T1LSA7_9CHRO|nr:DNA-processing protein DprA [Aphanothece hegewaldii]PSF32247.1 DNA-protecting protein DprA [Aphanothece hegewaldii CCALA 016]
MTKERAYWLAWSKIPGIGPVLLKRVYQHFDTLSDAWTASEIALRAIEGFGPKLIDTVVENRKKINPQEVFEQHIQKNPTFWTPADPDYPRLLLEIPSPPPVLYYRGTVDLRENQGLTPMVGIVGTRHPTEHGRRWAKRISIALAKQGFTVVSGMASGIDGEAHQSCINAGGRTIAVLGTGVDIVYPHHHRQLYEQIQKNGLVLSEYPAQTHPDKNNFPARNRIIAGLSRAILVLEAPEKSGSLITARYANEFGRDIYTLPNSPDVASARGCLRLVHQGAEVIITEEELLEMLGAIPQITTDSVPVTTPELEPEYERVYHAIATTPTSFDMIVQQSQLNAGEVSGILLQLELLGLVIQLPGMRYQINR